MSHSVKKTRNKEANVNKCYVSKRKREKDFFFGEGEGGGGEVHSAGPEGRDVNRVPLPIRKYA